MIVISEYNDCHITLKISSRTCEKLKLMIKINLLFLLLIFLDSSALAQDLFFKAGRNLTTYEYQNKAGMNVVKLNPGTGSSYAVGLGFPISPDFNLSDKYQKKGKPKDGKMRLYNEISLMTNYLNAFGGDQNNDYHYATTFGGIGNQLSILAFMGKLEFGIMGTIGVNKLISGTQVINNERYNLKNYEEFQRTFLHTGLGASIAYPLFDHLFLSINYQHTQNMRPKRQKIEYVNFKSKIISFGIHFKLD